MNNIFEILKSVTNFETIASNIYGAEVSEDIIITEHAIEVLTDEINTNYPINEMQANTNEVAPHFVRLYLQSTPDKSKKYNIRIDDKISIFDNIYSLYNIDIVVDRKSLFYFLGIIIDYIVENDEEGFVFLDTDDSKVADYYLFLAQGQAWLDYTDAKLLNSDYIPKRNIIKSNQINIEPEANPIEENNPIENETLPENTQTEENTLMKDEFIAEEEKLPAIEEFYEKNKVKIEQEVTEKIEEATTTDANIALAAEIAEETTKKENILPAATQEAQEEVVKHKALEIRTSTGLHFQD